MPWKECHVEDERLRFVARLEGGETMTALCAEFGISRKTGYKIYNQYQEVGLEGLTDRSRRPYRHANQLPAAIENAIVRLKREYPSWGAPKLRERLRQRYPALLCPAISTIHAVLDRHDLVTRRKRRRYRAEGTPLSRPDQPNDLWCADYKGEFMLADRRYCYPLTITDFASRYLLTCEALSTTKARYAFAAFERTFKEVGLPRAIRTDNGAPFASAHALYGLSKLSVWWFTPRHPDRTDPPGPSRAERPARADALDVEDRGDKASGRQRAPAAGPLRHVRRAVQPRAPASGARHEGPGRPLHPVPTPVSRARGAGVSDPRLDRHGDALRAPLLQAPENQSQSGVCRAGRRGTAGQ